MLNSPNETAETPLSPGFVKAALAVERYLLPLGYAYLAYQRVGTALEHYRQYQMLKGAGAATAHPHLQSIAYAALTKDLLMFLLMVFTGVILLFSRAPVVLPDKLKHVIVPMAMSCYFLLYGMVDRLPGLLRESLLSPNVQVAAAVCGLILSMVGYSIVIWALCHLGRSFAILVSVRKVVSSGPYNYVRHPIYLGYVIELCGLLLANCSIAMLLLGAGFVMFLVVRARMEEEKLCEADEGYRQYVQRTGFLLPRFLKPLP
ncbi:MAG: isoprenylcysteine carboxylmethyltransferase family protein [Chthoniobacteraceae bacterium]